MEWRESNGIRWLEAELADGRAAFSARHGGVSPDPYASLNLGILTGDEPSLVRQNRHRLAAALDLDPGGALMGLQVHGSELQRCESPPTPNPFADPGDPPEEADGQATDAAELFPLVLVADCLPVALSGARGVAMLHCGWRGLAAGIIDRGVREIEAGAAAIGPGIGPCCYEVGGEVLNEFSDLDGVAAGRMLDLAAVAVLLLERAGVRAIESAELCTHCHPELFFSHRRDGEQTGRQAGLVWKR
jgi:YfiH family protein